MLSCPKPSGKRILLLVGSQDQRGWAQRAEELLLERTGIECADVHLPDDLVELLNLIAAAEMVLTVDTAAAHFAAALDRSCVVLFSGLHQGMFGPLARAAPVSDG